VSLVDWLEADGDELVARYDRLYVPRNDPRWLRRNALVAAGNSGDASLLDAVAPFADGEDPLLRDHAQWAADRLSGRG
jgi:epoxyqueuosine reductase